MRRNNAINLCLIACLFGVAVQAQSLNEYLKVRKQYKIQATAPSIALEMAGGTRVIEVAGKIVGKAAGGEHGQTIIVDAGEAGTLLFRVSNLPKWMDVGGQIARILVQVKRKDEFNQPEYKMVAAVPDNLMKRWEAENKPKPPPNIKFKKNTTPSYASHQTVSIEQALPSYSAVIGMINKRLTQKERESIARSLLTFSVKFGVDARLVMALVIAESRFNPVATSRAGAKGLGQLMPTTARGMGVVDPYDPEDNLQASVKIIGGHLRKYGGTSKLMSWDQIALALASYNAGSGAVRKYGGVPPYKETQNYIRKVISIYKQLAGIR